jgi:hypothetical protein
MYIYQVGEQAGIASKERLTHWLTAQVRPKRSLQMGGMSADS